MLAAAEICSHHSVSASLNFLGKICIDKPKGNQCCTPIRTDNNSEFDDLFLMLANNDITKNIVWDTKCHNYSLLYYNYYYISNYFSFPKSSEWPVSCHIYFNGRNQVLLFRFSKLKIKNYQLLGRWFSQLNFLFNATKPLEDKSLIVCLCSCLSQC